MVAFATVTRVYAFLVVPKTLEVEIEENAPIHADSRTKYSVKIKMLSSSVCET